MLSMGFASKIGESDPLASLRSRLPLTRGRLTPANDTSILPLDKGETAPPKREPARASIK
jgi:hypothetical protein